MKEIGNKIKLKQEKNIPPPRFFINLRKREGIKAFKKDYVLKRKRRKNNYEFYEFEPLRSLV